MTEIAKCRVTRRQRLRVLEAAVRHGIGEAVMVRRALLAGLDLIEGAEQSTDGEPCE